MFFVVSRKRYSTPRPVTKQKNRGRNSDPLPPTPQLPRHSPIQSLRTDRLQLVPLFPPSPPTSILQPDPISNLILMPRHTPPTSPDVFFCPVMGEVVYADGGESGLDVFDRGSSGRVYREGGEVGDDLGHGDGWWVSSRNALGGKRRWSRRCSWVCLFR